jgi:hypothetical protein
MDNMDSIWNGHGMVMEFIIPYGILDHSIWIPYGLRHIQHGIHGHSNMESMDIPTWNPWTLQHGIHGQIPYGFHGQIPYGFHGQIPYGIHGITME